MVNSCSRTCSVVSWDKIAALITRRGLAAAAIFFDLYAHVLGQRDEQIGEGGVAGDVAVALIIRQNVDDIGISSSNRRAENDSHSKNTN